ncbi:hypothetical protein [Desulfovibrio ferrophilus]|uniref:Uncharacterized protein n=1 Tax=Desulfovibrio ferrophilus TaxID=241368 RepID=A0A2Z6AVZ3_9BACT|nr:hypothetical protein [Desulfovibrio ferrophilus]BBD07412.1 uncharacterized protein DFE_0686 [Desulfovibrio ferrophilus]
MTMPETSMQEHVRSVVLERLDQDADKRTEALTEFFGVTMSGADTVAMDKLADLVPPLLPKLYEKWVGMFVERFFETVPKEQIELLCDGSDENNAAILLIYLMFLESQRMEDQIDKDLKEYGLSMTGADDTGDLASSYIRAKMTQLGKTIKKQGDN